MKKWIKEKIKELIAWYVLRYEHGCFDVKRKGEAEQTCRIFSKEAHENIVKKAFSCGCYFYSQDQINIMLAKNMIKIREYGNEHKNIIPVSVAETILRNNRDMEKIIKED